MEVFWDVLRRVTGARPQRVWKIAVQVAVVVPAEPPVAVADLVTLEELVVVKTGVPVALGQLVIPLLDYVEYVLTQERVVPQAANVARELVGLGCA